MEQLLRDLRHAARLLTVDRGFAVAALVTTALGIGGATAMFSVVYGVLLRPLPYPEPQRLVRVWEQHPGAEPRLGFRALLSRPTWHAWARASNAIEELGTFDARTFLLTRGPGSQRVRGANVTPSLLRLLRATPAAGRLLTDADAEIGAAPVVVLTDAGWREQFDRAASAIGAVMRIDAIERRIVGIVPPGFELPEDSRTDGRPPVLFYAPFRIPDVDPAATAVATHRALARLRPGVSIAQAEAEGTARARDVDRPMADLTFGKGRPVEVRVRAIVDQMTSDVRPVLLMLAGGVGLVLLIACANLANLFLARGSGRRRELAVRGALGASRGRLVRQLFTESLAMALAGGLFGIALGWALTAAVPALAPATLPRIDQIRVDAWFLAIAVSAMAFVGTLSGLAPALRGSRVDLVATMNAGSARTDGDSGRVFRRTLLAVQTALAVVLLVGGALLARSFIALVSVDAGYQPARVLTANLHLPDGDDRGRRLGEVTSDMLTRLRRMPGVEAAGAGSMAPFGDILSVVGFALPGRVTDDGRPMVARALHTVITPGYAEALGMRLTRGRLLRDEDLRGPLIAMLVNERFVRTYLRDGQPVVGRRFTGLFARLLKRSDAIVDIVGVVQDVLPDRFDGAPEPQIYLPAGAGFALSSAKIVVKVDADARDLNDPALSQTLRALARQAAPDATIDGIGPLSARVWASAAEPRFALSILAVFAMLAVTLAAAGLYAALSYDVARRRRELGVRAALGATRGNLVAMIVGEGLKVTTIGLLAGSVVAMLGAQSMRAVLFRVAPLDLVSFSAAPVLLLVVALSACLIPARRGARLDPAEILRAD
jgi:putative ABC transport system permease protein